MVEHVPIVRSTRQLIEQARAREEALSKLDEVMAQATGSAYDDNQLVRVTVDARGKLLDLRLDPRAAEFGERLGYVIVEVAKAAQHAATQAGYNKAALLLGDEMTYALEQLSGVPAPARADNDDSGLTIDEFQRRREERLGAAGSGEPAQPSPTLPADDDDWASFDPASLRSDR